MAGQRTVGDTEWTSPWVQCALVCLCLVGMLGEAAEDPGAQWVSAYGWIQTGDKLAASKLWPLAIGSYIEADRQIKMLANEHPTYEPDVIDYRLEKLKEDIAAAQKELTSGEHDLMMKYLDFIESFELGKKQRFENQFEDSITTLSEARSILDDLIEEKPDEIESAVKTQHELLDDSIDWLYSQVRFKRQSSRVVSVSDGYDWGSTQFVKESDLPSSGDPVQPNGGLFPNVPLAGVPVAVLPNAADSFEQADNEKPGMKETQSGESELNERGGGSGTAMRFRMNSKSKVAGGKISGETE